MPSRRRDAWLAAGQPRNIAWPIVDLAARLRGYGYTVGTVGDTSHMMAVPAEDHTFYSDTGWPGISPLGWCLALDVMPPAAGSGLPSLAQLGRQMIADRVNGHPGMAWLKYQNSSPYGPCVHDSWEPGHVQRPSSDIGHIHQSCYTTFLTSRCVRDSGYDPVARVRAGGGIQPVVLQPVVYVYEMGWPPFPGRVLVAQPGAAMMHGSDVLTWQRRMATRGWSITADGWYFVRSALVCGKFQLDSTAHGWPLVHDEKVGPYTWRAAGQRPISH